MRIKDLERHITSHRLRIGVMGLGYVGLPLALRFAEAGFRVTGLDKDKDRVDQIAQGRSYITDVADRDLKRELRAGRFQATTDEQVLADQDAILICVPTPLKSRYTPDISYIISAVQTIARFLKKGHIVVLESTTYPGTTREWIVPLLEQKGLKAGRDFFVAFSPERIDPGNKRYDVSRIPKVVGGLTPTCTRLTQRLYEQIICQVHPVSSPEAAEMTKLLENTFRIINIGWINEVAMMSHRLGIDVWEVIAAAATKPFGFMPFYPGLGVGGHCIPDDPLYLYWKAKKKGFASKYIKLAADTNHHMPQYCIERIKQWLNTKTLNKKRILVLGVTYKKDVKDLRKSPSLKLMEQLDAEKATVGYHDPLIPYLNVPFRLPYLESQDLKPSVLKSHDVVVVAVDHSGVDYEMVWRCARRIFDVRNVYAGRRHPKLQRL